MTIAELTNIKEDQDEFIESLMDEITLLKERNTELEKEVISVTEKLNDIEEILWDIVR